jgi:predicted TIM-barrel fold metal-dependent hydrolase
MDLVMSGTKRPYPECKIILSHAGRTLPPLLPRAAQLVSRLPPNFSVQRSTEDIVANAKSFYFYLALATSPEILDTFSKHFPTDRILFGSDMPYAQEGAVMAFNQLLNEYPLSEELKRMFAYENAMAPVPEVEGINGLDK